MKQKRTTKNTIVTILATLLILTAFWPQVKVLAAGASDWTSYRGAPDNNAVVVFEEPIGLADERVWSNMVGDLGEWGTNSKSSFLLIDERLYFASEDQLYQLDRAGHVVGQMTLSGMVGYTAIPVYNEWIIIPLDGGALEAVDPKTMTSQWVSLSPAAEGEYLQNGNALQVADGVVYSLTQLLDENWMSVKGTIQAVDLLSGESLWIREDIAIDSEAGYNLTGAFVLGDKLLVVGEKGEMVMLDKRTGETVATESIGAKVKSLLVQDGDLLYFTTFDGRLLAYEVKGQVMTKRKDIAFSVKSNSTPVIYEGKAYVGGLLEYADWETGTPAVGIFAVIDLETEEVVERYETEGEVQSSPLLMAGTDAIYVYFTVNNEVGALYAYDKEAISEVYVPEEESRQYSMFSPVADEQGTVYYANDSGYVFALQSLFAEEPVETEPAPTDPAVEQEPTVTSPERNEAIEKGSPKWPLAAGIAVAVILVNVIIWRIVLRLRKK